MHVREVLRVARDAVTSMISKVSPFAERPPVLGSVVDDFSDLRLPARGDLGIEFVHIPALGDRTGFSGQDAIHSPLRGATHGLVKVKVQSPLLSGSVVMSAGDARQVEWALERQVSTSGFVAEIPSQLASRLKASHS